MNFKSITEACQKAEELKDQITEEQARNAMLNLRGASECAGIDPHTLREWHLEGDKVVYDSDVSKEQAFLVIESIRQWAQGWIDNPVQ